MNKPVTDILAKLVVHNLRRKQANGEKLTTLEKKILKEAAK